MKVLRIRQVIEKVSLGQSTIYRLIAEGKFPKPFPLMPKRNGWLESDIDAWISERIEGHKQTTHLPTE